MSTEYIAYYRINSDGVIQTHIFKSESEEEAKAEADTLIEERRGQFPDAELVRLHKVIFEKKTK